MDRGEHLDSKVSLTDSNRAEGSQPDKGLSRGNDRMDPLNRAKHTVARRLARRSRGGTTRQSKASNERTAIPRTVVGSHVSLQQSEHEGVLTLAYTDALLTRELKGGGQAGEVSRWQSIPTWKEEFVRSRRDRP
jgi:hypothetical protein